MGIVFSIADVEVIDYQGSLPYVTMIGSLTDALYSVVVTKRDFTLSVNLS